MTPPASAVSRLRSLWEGTFYRPLGPVSLRATRVLLAAHALWVLLSRPDLPTLVDWPLEFRVSVPALQAARIGFGALPSPVEQGLFWALHASLAACLLGPWPRLACGVSAALLYHFAPFEEIVMGMPHTFFGGLTLPVLGLFVLAVADTPTPAASPENRWPVVLVRLLMAGNYFFAGIAKLRFTGPQWFTAANLRDWAIENWSFSGAPWALAFAADPVAPWAAALGTLALELLFPLAAVSSGAAAILVPLAALGHVGIALTLGIFFPSAPLLFLYVDWDALAARVGRPHSGGGT